jgi:hypothetical protein
MTFVIIFNIFLAIIMTQEHNFFIRAKKVIFLYGEPISKLV